MIQIRRNVFETNSSSTHSLAVPQDYSTYNIKKKKINFHLGSYGRPSKPVKANPADYLYTAIMQNVCWFMWCDGFTEEAREAIISSSDTPDWRKYCLEAVNRLNKLKAILDEYHIKYEFEEPVWGVEFDWNDRKSYGFLRDEKYAKKTSWHVKNVADNKKERVYYVDRSFGIDHCDEAKLIVDMLLANPEECIKFLLGGKVIVGSDECDDEEAAQVHWNRKTYTRHYWVDENGVETKWSWKRSEKLELKKEELPNPYYMEGYNFYLKGN